MDNRVWIWHFHIKWHLTVDGRTCLAGHKRTTTLRISNDGRMDELAATRTDGISWQALLIIFIISIIIILGEAEEVMGTGVEHDKKTKKVCVFHWQTTFAAIGTHMGA